MYTTQGRRAAMVLVTVNLHPKALSPQEAAKAWFLKKKQKKSWPEVKAECVNLKGQPAGEKAVRQAVARMCQPARGHAKLGQGKYKNCGRRYGADGGKYKITPTQEKQVVAPVITQDSDHTSSMHGWDYLCFGASAASRPRTRQAGMQSGRQERDRQRETDKERERQTETNRQR